MLEHALPDDEPSFGEGTASKISCCSRRGVGSNLGLLNSFLAVLLGLSIFQLLRNLRITTGPSVVGC